MCSLGGIPSGFRLTTIYFSLGFSTIQMIRHSIRNDAVCWQTDFKIDKEVRNNKCPEVIDAPTVHISDHADDSQRRLAPKFCNLPLMGGMRYYQEGFHGGVGEGV